MPTYRSNFINNNEGTANEEFSNGPWQKKLSGDENRAFHTKLPYVGYFIFIWSAILNSAFVDLFLHC